MSILSSIPSAKSTWETQNKEEFEKSVQSVVRDIQRASKQGFRKTCFNPYDHRHYEAVKRVFEFKGYYFTPTGYVGGVWQHTENINW